MPTPGPSPTSSRMGTFPLPCARTHVRARAHTHTLSHRASETMTRGPFLFKDSCQRMVAQIQHCSRFAQGSLIKEGGGRKSLPLSLSFPPSSSHSLHRSLPPQFNTDLTAGIILQRRLFADAAELSIRADTQSGSNVTSPHYVNG